MSRLVTVTSEKRQRGKRRPQALSVRASVAAGHGHPGRAIRGHDTPHGLDQQVCPDILVNNAGVTVGAPIDSELADESAFDRQLAINYTSVVAAVRAAFPLLPTAGGSSVSARAQEHEWASPE